jgi:Response regulator containing a CheY-like receiver domain and an HTH DNA-binding domain
MIHHVSETEPEGLGAPEPLDLSPVSEREREVLDAAIEGLSARDIAQRLSLSEATVRSHLSTVYAKLGVAGRVELLARLNATAPHREVAVASEQAQHEEARAAHVPPKHARRLLALGAVALAVATAAIAFSMLRPDLPPRSDLATASRLLAAGQLSSLDLRGETLTLLETSGDRLRVEGVEFNQFKPIIAEAMAKSVGVRVSSDGDSLGTAVAMLATALLPVLALIVAVGLLLRALRRPPWLRPASVEAFNSRGVVTRGPGGDQERELAKRYGDLAKSFSATWHRTAGIYRGLEDEYERLGRFEDEREAQDP